MFASLLAVSTSLALCLSLLTCLFQMKCFIHLRQLRTMQQQPLYDNHPRMPQWGCQLWSTTLENTIMPWSMYDTRAHDGWAANDQNFRATSMHHTAATSWPHVPYGFIWPLINLQSCKSTISTWHICTILHCLYQSYFARPYLSSYPCLYFVVRSIISMSICTFEASTKRCPPKKHQRKPSDPKKLLEKRPPHGRSPDSKASRSIPCWCILWPSQKGDGTWGIGHRMENGMYMIHMMPHLILDFGMMMFEDIHGQSICHIPAKGCWNNCRITREQISLSQKDVPHLLPTHWGWIQGWLRRSCWVFLKGTRQTLPGIFGMWMHGRRSPALLEFGGFWVWDSEIGQG